MWFQSTLMILLCYLLDVYGKKSHVKTFVIASKLT